MNKPPNIYGIIPARFDSTRFPGKPLADILGKPMFWHVFNQASQCRELKQVVLATDDNRIASAAESLNVPAVMTRADHPSGTDRVLEAAEKLQVSEDSVVINIQGDEPALNPAMLTELVHPFKNQAVNVSTLVHKIDSKEAENPDRVKVVLANDGKALYFSRSPIPFPRDGQGLDYLGHIGLYAFRMKTLRAFVALGPGYLESTEKLEQLRLLENSIPIHVVITKHQSFCVDRPEDIQKVLSIMKR